mmetsp:Transcript_1860/g.3821  ORF Transcript_1860/g.3821 Transcript_1860/m.3821 type:complete len:98 (-) Transcript_1860:4-297(-)
MLRKKLVKRFQKKVSQWRRLHMIRTSKICSTSLRCSMLLPHHPRQELRRSRNGWRTSANLLWRLLPDRGAGQHHVPCVVRPDMYESTAMFFDHEFIK